MDQEVQVGEPWAEVLVKEAYNPALTQDRRFERILQRIQRGGWTVGTFLQKLFSIPTQSQLSRSQRHAQLVSAFLRGAARDKISADHIAELMYASKDSAPKAVRQRAGENVEKERPDATNMARYRLSEWAIQKVEGYVRAVSTQISSKEGGFHLTKHQTTWEYVHGFSLAKAIAPIELKGAVLLRIVAAAALPAVLSEKLRKTRVEHS
jgi:hypothetical protein